MNTKINIALAVIASLGLVAITSTNAEAFPKSSSFRLIASKHVLPTSQVHPAASQFKIKYNAALIRKILGKPAAIPASPVKVVQCFKPPCNPYPGTAYYPRPWPGSKYGYGGRYVVASGSGMAEPSAPVAASVATPAPAPVSAPEVCERVIDAACYFAKRPFTTPQGTVFLCVKVCDQQQPQQQQGT